MSYKIGIIGGSGLYEVLDDITDQEEGLQDTPFGTAEYIQGKLSGQDVIYISRHGSKSKSPPHMINYKANIHALRELGVGIILTTTAVGALNFRYELGTLIIPDQFVDMTKQIYTFFNGGDEGLAHVDISDPFCPDVRAILNKVAKELDISLSTGGTYVCLSGPTFETKAEIKLLKTIGMDMVGMTLAPECKLAREKEMCYVPLALPVNWGAGLSDDVITHETTVTMVDTMKDQVLSILKKTVPELSGERTCQCSKPVKVYT